MCGRYSLSTSLDELVETFPGVEVVSGDYHPRFNVAPTQEAPVLVRGPAGLRLGMLRWGLVPHWARDPRVGSRMINARAETVRTLPAFREAFARRRCLVPADGFYEWSAAPPPEGKEPARAGRTGKVPHWIHRPDRRPFTFAGLWERWRPPDGEPLHSFTILTTDASPSLRPLHHRMPVVIPPEARSRWLARDAHPEDLEAILSPAPDDMFEAWPVSTLVNSPQNDHPTCIMPLGDGEATGGA